MNLQVIGSFIDVIILLGVGFACFFFPDKLVRTGTGDERFKKIRMLRLASVVILVAAVVRLVLKFA